jgi:hypothetical protein
MKACLYLSPWPRPSESFAKPGFEEIHIAKIKKITAGYHLRDSLFIEQIT